MACRYRASQANPRTDSSVRTERFRYSDDVTSPPALFDRFGDSGFHSRGTRYLGHLSTFGRALITSLPPPRFNWYESGTENLRNGAYHQASKAFKQAIAVDSEFALARARLAQAWTELDYIDRAKDELLEVTRLTRRRSWRFHQPTHSIWTQSQPWRAAISVKQLRRTEQSPSSRLIKATSMSIWDMPMRTTANPIKHSRIT